MAWQAEGAKRRAAQMASSGSRGDKGKRRPSEDSTEGTDDSVETLRSMKFDLTDSTKLLWLIPFGASLFQNQARPHWKASRAAEETTERGRSAEELTEGNKDSIDTL